MQLHWTLMCNHHMHETDSRQSNVLIMVDHLLCADLSMSEVEKKILNALWPRAACESNIRKMFPILASDRSCLWSQLEWIFQLNIALHQSL